MHLVVTDSGLGGLSVCARLERAMRGASDRRVRLTYVNAWPEQGHGYNSLPDPVSRARVFDTALRAMAEMRPDAIVLACNTLSILYELTDFRHTAAIPVHGIVDAGVDLFVEALRAEPAGSLVVLGTRTTVESGVHRERLARRGIGPERIAGVSCHGLATAIEQGPASADVAALISTCADGVVATGLTGEPLFAGLCCTHYGMVEEDIRAALAARTGATVGTLDPNARLVEQLLGTFAPAAGAEHDRGTVAIEVISKVELTDAQRRGVGAVLEPISPLTARALFDYRRVPDLF